MRTKFEKQEREKFKHLGKYMNLQLQLPNFKEVNGIIYKLCSKCKKYYPMNLDYFPKRDNVKCGFDSHCKKCHNEKEKQRVRKSPFNEKGELKCLICGKYKPVSEFNKSSKNKTRLNFSRECKACESERKKKYRSNFSNSNVTYYFKHLIYGCRTRSKVSGVLCDLTSDQLISLFLQQNKKCALSGIEMTTIRQAGKNPYNASIDRIAPGGNYTLSNIRLVCNHVNMMRSNLSDEELLYFCILIVKENEK